MAWLCKNKIPYPDGLDGWKDQTEVIFRFKPYRDIYRWFNKEESVGCPLPDGSIYALTGVYMDWDDEPMELSEIPNYV